MGARSKRRLPDRYAMQKALRIWTMRAASAGCALVVSAGGCLSSEDVDLGHNVAPGPTVGPEAAAPSVMSPDGAIHTDPPTCAVAEGLSVACDAGVPDLSAPTTDGASSPAPEGSVVPPPPVVDEAGSVVDGATGSTFCLKDASFEPLSNTVTTGNAPPYWQLCPNFNLPTLPILPVINPSICTMQPSDGMNYVGLTVGSYGPTTDASESMGTLLCAELVAGTTYSVSVDLGIAVKTLMNLGNATSGLPAVLELWGAKTPCGKDELLWRSAPITNQDTWKTNCALFTPTQNALYLTLAPESPPGSSFAMGDWSYVVVDHIVTGATCK